MKKNILVFPCGSEIALEFYRSVHFSPHFRLIGANSIDDHGRFVYDEYVGTVPFITSSDFIPLINRIVQKYKIDAIFTAMDSVISILKNNENILGCKVICSPVETVDICLSKYRTYMALNAYILTPRLYTYNEIDTFPIFAKPDVGYGSRGTKLIKNQKALEDYHEDYPDSLYCEYLPFDEYTVDCFTNRKGELLFWAPRERRRVMNGISVNTVPVREGLDEFEVIVEKINANMRFRGAWFVQLKRNKSGELCLLEVASRFGGSSSLFRLKGVNFALLSLYDAFDIDVGIIENDYSLELDRSLTNVYRIALHYDEVFVDFDDCILLGKSQINIQLVSFLYKCINNKIKITLLTRHSDNIYKTLENNRLLQVFDRVIHLKPEEKKSDYIDNLNSIFIDDSYQERHDVSVYKQIPVFSIDMVEGLI